MFLLALLLFFVTLEQHVAGAETTPDVSSFVWPPELYSPLIPQKLLDISSVQHTPVRYPQYTDHIIGKWKWFSPDLWTTGFFPATLYELNTRRQLCHGSGAGDVGMDWVGLGRSWSTAEVPLEVKNHVGHDVGFLSYPFVQELLLCVLFSPVAGVYQSRSL